MEDYTRASKYLLKTIELNPKDLDAYKKLSKLYLKLNDKKKAIGILNLAINNNEQNGEIFYYLAILHKDIDLEKYKKFLNLALNNADTLPFSDKIILNKLKKLN